MRRVEPPQDALVHLGVGDVDVGHAVDPPGDLDELVELLDKLRDLSSEAGTDKNHNKSTYLVHNRGELALEAQRHGLFDGEFPQDIHEAVLLVSARILHAHGSV